VSSLFHNIKRQDEFNEARILPARIRPRTDVRSKGGTDQRRIAAEGKLAQEALEGKNLLRRLYYGYDDHQVVNLG